jgi:hypothetical protein
MTAYIAITDLIKKFKGMKQKCIVRIYDKDGHVHEMTANRSDLGEHIHTEEHILKNIPDGQLTSSSTLIIGSTQCLCLQRENSCESCMDLLISILKKYEKLAITIFYCKPYWEDLKWFLRLKSEGKYAEIHSYDKFIGSYMIELIAKMNLNDRNIQIYHVIKNKFIKIL